MIENLRPKNQATRCSYCTDTVSGEWVCTHCSAVMHHECVKLNIYKCGACKHRANREPDGLTQALDDMLPLELRPDYARIQYERRLHEQREQRQQQHSRQRFDERFDTLNERIEEHAARIEHLRRPIMAVWWADLVSVWGRFAGWISGLFSRLFSRNFKQKALCVIGIIAILGSLWGYKTAYENSAEAITITVADKEVRTHVSRDDNGNTTTRYTYVIYTHGGEEFNCGTLGSGGENIYNQFQTNQSYEVVVAGLGVFDRDIVAVNRHLRKR